MADRFEDLRNFVAIASSGGLNAAAAELGIAKSAVSRRLAELEARLGISLVNRSSRRLELTSVGQGYYRRAREILRSLHELDSIAGSTVGGHVLKVSADPLLQRHLLVDALHSFGGKAEGLRAELALPDDTSAEVLITCDSVPNPISDACVVRSWQSVICASPDYLSEFGRPVD